MSKSTVQSGKLKQAIMISAIMHIILFVALVSNSFDEHVDTLNDKQNTYSIDAVMLDQSALVHNYNQQPIQQKGINRIKEITKKSPAEPAKKSPAEPAKKSPAEPAKKSPAEPAKKSPAEPAKKSPAEPAKKSPAEAQTVNKSLGELNSSKNASKTDNEIKGNKLSLTESSNIENDNTLTTEINNYAKQIKFAIESQFYDAASYTGKTCTLRIKLAPDGILLDIKFEKGDKELCAAALAAARQARIPKAPSQGVYEVFKSTSLDFKP